MPHPTLVLTRDVNQARALPSRAMTPDLMLGADFTQRLVLDPPMLPKRIPLAAIAPTPDVLLPVPAGTPLDAEEARIFTALVAAYGNPLSGDAAMHEGTGSHD